MSNLFIAGKSGNEAGRPKGSARSVRGMVDRFIRRQCTPTRLGKIFNQLSPQAQADMLLQLLPFTIAKQAPEGISREEVEALYNMVQQKLTTNGKAV